MHFFISLYLTKLIVVGIAMEGGPGALRAKPNALLEEPVRRILRGDANLTLKI